ncbi:hypothetical protein J7077_002129 [Vibrio parahaemolyticus]|uniref:hypothetical protein n=1 Tax=Vibrio harveyi group TaxID=717610 RepID=UPI001DE8560E|nr:hypothetical protein [Vibrio alginolyticus]EHH2551009.1 hypothetical protein [Vibrio parahaemolyticus]EHH3639517.1 hypothetical protein [Vibrio parahaemolyticus]EIU6798032.1 hypothetical protein [Vibrio parahaemolyticus]ELA9862130.1 hypothetical protein [Vibrio parahaemolyticus]MCS0135042.1 hypothetical protein [Vibrio alginolyticus]
MTKVFISGSMRIKNLDENVKYRLAHLIESDYEVIVGDADGVDTSIQEFFFQHDYTKVTVYCTGGQPRNNVGRWTVVNIESKASPGSRDFFTAKDLAMAKDCDFGLMIWDTKSTGTLSNAIELLSLDKKSRVYVNKEKLFVRVTNVEDLEHLVSYMSDFAFKKADSKIRLSHKIESIKHRSGSLF